MTTYSRFEVRYLRKLPYAPLTGRARLIEDKTVHVWGWAVDRKELDRLIKSLASNPHLQHTETVDRLAARPQRETPAFEPIKARPGLLL